MCDGECIKRREVGGDRVDGLGWSKMRGNVDPYDIL